MEGLLTLAPQKFWIAKATLPLQEKITMLTQWLGVITAALTYRRQMKHVIVL